MASLSVRWLPFLNAAIVSLEATIEQSKGRFFSFSFSFCLRLFLSFKRGKSDTRMVGDAHGPSGRSKSQFAQGDVAARVQATACIAARKGGNKFRESISALHRKPANR